MITLSFPQTPLKELNMVVERTPSMSWFAVTALESFKSSGELLAHGRIKKDNFEQLNCTEENHNLTCWRCNGKIFHPVNDGWCQPYKAKAKFNDHFACKGKHNDNPVLCTACEAVSDRAYHPNFKLKAVFTVDRAYQVTTDEDLIAFLVQPPSPPFVFFVAESNSQHMIWLSSLTLDARFLSLHKGRSRYIVDRVKALALANQFLQTLNLTNNIREKTGKSELSTPFLSSRMDINSLHGTNMQLSHGIMSAASSTDADASLSALIDRLDCTPYTYGTWLVATYYVKAMLVPGFQIKPSNEWKTITPPSN